MTKHAYTPKLLLTGLMLAFGSTTVFGGCAPAGRGGVAAVRSGRGDADADRGIKAYVEGNYELAVDLLKSALDKGVHRHPRSTVYTILGNVYYEMERLDDSIEAHQEALRLDPQNHKAWNNLGVTYRLTGEFRQAAECYDKALELKPDYAEGLASRGAPHIFLDEPEKAIVTLEKAIKIDPSVAVAHSNLAMAYASVGRFDEADARLTQAIVLGYRNGPILKQRIDALRAVRPE